jgi:hypothetical protein
MEYKKGTLVMRCKSKLLYIPIIFCIFFSYPNYLKAHDGPHDDYEPPEYRFEHQNHQALLSVRSLKNTFIITFKTSLKNLINSESVGTKKEDLLLESLKSINALMDFPKVSACNLVYAKADRFKKHRSIKEGLNDLKKNERGKYIEPFIEVILSYKVTCEKSIKDQEISLNILEKWPEIKRLKLLANSKKPNIAKDGEILVKDLKLVF